MARIVYTDMSGVEQSIPIDHQSPIISVGRAVDCHIRSNRKSVSRHHAEIICKNGLFEVRDLNSSNGTFLIINDQRRAIMGSEYITHNDEVWCGDFVLRFVDDALENQMPAPLNLNPAFDSNAHGATQPPPSQPLETKERAPIPTFNGSPAAWAPSKPTFAPHPPQVPPAHLEASSDASYSNNLDDLERLRAEKSSIEDLAARQAKEIERLEGVLNNDSPAGESQPLEDEIVNLRSENETLKEELTRQSSDTTASELEREVSELRSLNESLTLDLTRAKEEAEKEAKEKYDALLDEKNIEIAELKEQNLEISKKLHDQNELENDLREENSRLSNTLQANSEITDDSQSTIALLESQILKLNIEKESQTDKLKTLMDQLQAHKNDKQSAHGKLSDVEKENENKSKQIANLEREVVTLEDELRELDDKNQQGSEKSSLLEKIENLERDNNSLQSEKSKLEEDIRSLKELQSKGDIELQKLKDTTLELQSCRDDSPIDPELITFLTRLERMVDAIQRTDLAPLSTVDRVRLQSAIRETKPKETLNAFLKKQ